MNLLKSSNKYKLNLKKLPALKSINLFLILSQCIGYFNQKELDVIIKKEDSKKEQIYRGQKYTQIKKFQIKRKNQNH